MHQSNRTSVTSHFWRKLIVPVSGFCALAWFLLRVIPKPSRAAYPCQRAAFPVASAFVVWGFGSLSGLFSIARFRRLGLRYLSVVMCIGAVIIIGCAGWVMHLRAISGAEIATRYDYTPKLRNMPMGVARGINPGRVTWVRDPLAAQWSGHIDSATDQWWMDANTNQLRVDALLSTTLRSLTNSATDDDAWVKIFVYYNQRARGLQHRGYQPGEAVAVKVNLNNSSAAGPGNIVNVSPQVALAMVRQLVNRAHVRPADIIVYDARRDIYPAMLAKIWSEFRDVRFVQWDAPTSPQPINPGYGGYHGLEQAQWVEGVSYSLHKDEYHDAKLIPKQVFDATYLVNVALLKEPLNNAEL